MVPEMLVRRSASRRSNERGNRQSGLHHGWSFLIYLRRSGADRTVRQFKLARAATPISSMGRRGRDLGPEKGSDPARPAPLPWGMPVGGSAAPRPSPRPRPCAGRGPECGLKQAASGFLEVRRCRPFWRSHGSTRSRFHCRRRPCLRVRAHAGDCDRAPRNIEVAQR